MARKVHRQRPDLTGDGDADAAVGRSTARQSPTKGLANVNPLATWLGPILGWEMTTLVRRARYFGMRVAFTLIVFFVLWSSYAELNFAYRNQSQITALAQFATRFFHSFSFVELLAVLLLTPAYVATSIAVEKQRRTIDYLFATDLRNREIVLGKWAARSANVLMLLLAGLPIMSIAQLLGGIDPERQFALVLMCASATASTAALAIYVSVHSNDVRRALGNAYALLALLLATPLFYLAGIAILDEVERALGSTPRIAPAIQRLVEVSGLKYLNESAHPFVYYYSAIEGSWFNRPMSSSDLLNRTVTFAISHAGLSVVFLALATLQLRSAWLKATGEAKKGRSAALKNWRPFVSRKEKPVGNAPMLWKEWHFGEQRRGGCAGKVLSAIAVIALYFPILQFTFEQLFSGGSSRTWSAEAINYYLRFMGTAVLGLSLGKVAIRAASSIGVERDRDCWVSLLATRLVANEIVAGKAVGALKPTAWTLLLMTPMFLFASVTGALSPLAVPCVYVVSTIFAGFVASLGIYQSLKRATTGKAIGWTLTICILLAGIGHSLFGIVLMPLFFFGVRSEAIGMFYYASIPWVAFFMSMFGHARADESLIRMAPYVLCWLGIYAVAAVALFHRSVERFAHSSGRTEDVLPRSAAS